MIARALVATAAVLYTALALSACPPPIGPAAPPDAADAIAPTSNDATPTPRPDATDAYAAACDALGRVGCLVYVDCPRVLAATQDDPRFRHYDLTCVTRALVPDDVRACGLECLPPHDR